jgi:hypothetical protein
LSKTIVEHFGHFVQSPSGISRFFDFPAPSFGFLANAVSVLLAGGGVTAGSTDSVPGIFFVIDVVPIRLPSLLL